MVFEKKIMNTIKIIKKDNYAIVQLNRGKVNAVNLEMVKELTTTFQSLKAVSYTHLTLPTTPYV